METHDVVVIGAGMAGLTCAVELTRADIDVLVLEASDAVGGRIRTDRVDGMLLDRGFQLLNPAYPALRGLVDVPALDLQYFEAGVVAAHARGRWVLANPLRSPRDAVRLPSRSTGSIVAKARFASYAVSCAVAPARRIRARDDIPYGAALERAGVNGRLRTAILEPFLAGVLAEDEQQTSRRFVDMLLRTFARRVPGLPADGMQALPRQVAGLLAADRIQLGTRADAVEAGVVHTSAGTWRARCVVVATDGTVAGELTGLPVPRMRGLTTFYHRAPASPAARRMLHLDGDRRGPVLNSAVVSDVAPAYCRDGALIASTVLGADDSAATRAAVEEQLALIYGVPVDGWQLVATYPIAAALPAMLPPLNMRQPVTVGDRLFVAGDHRDTASIQGAIVSGRRAATAVRRALGAAAG